MRVYHLLSVENGLSNVALKRIRISRVRDLNDPFELLAAKLGEKQFRTGLRNWRAAFNESNGLLCFSKKWENPVLWSHYAVKHRGMCLGFDLSEDLAEEVRYIPDRLPILFIDSDPQKGLEESFVRDMLTTKFLHWQYEEEVRVFLRLDPATVEGTSYFYSFGEKLRLAELVLGPLCELPIQEVRSLVHSAYDRVTVYKSRLAFKWFSVVPDERSVREENAYWEARVTGEKKNSV
jgi:hypothetical protein